MGNIDPSHILSDSEFNALAPAEQDAYLSLLADIDSDWTLSPKQQLADSLADQVTEFLYGGAAGGGKSEWILHRAHRLSREIPGHRSLLLRTKFPELRRSLMSRSILLFGMHSSPEEMPKWRASDKEWRYPNGSVIEFGFCENDDDVGQYLSAEYDMIAFDEATQFTEYQYEMVRSRARTTQAKKALGARPHVIAATNPGQRGHAYWKGLFVEHTAYGQNNPVLLRQDGDRWAPVREGDVYDPEATRLIAFVPSTVADNPHIDPAYVRHLKTLPEKLQRQYLYGDWDVFEGQFFDEFRRNRITDQGAELPWHVVDPFEIPASWPKIRAIDWGFAAPFCCLWLAWDPDGVCYVYREVYATRLSPKDQARAVLGAEAPGERVDRTVADPACWSQREALTIAAQWRADGLVAGKASNDRIAGWQRTREWLKATEDGPGLRIFSTCTNLVRTLPLMIHDKTKPEDLDTTLEDHAVDALRYGLMTRPRRIVEVKQELTGMAARVARTFRHRTRSKSRLSDSRGLS